jgi:serine/threonine protein kinase
MRQPTKFGKYLLLERVAVGGMAEVFVAKAFGVEGFERLLAIKKILPTMGEDEEFISMFVDEARIAVQLAHPNIVQVLELGKSEDTLFIAMEYISGRDLRQLMERFRRRQKPLPLAQAAYVVKEVCEALDHAHNKCDAQGRPLGIVHRDVSPQNVLVSFEGQVKLIDFGIAKAESRLQKTQAGILKGKFSYMSPEQVKGQPLDGRSDLFACGILLWELSCGEKLFSGESDYAVLDKVRMGLVPPPRSRNPLIPDALERVILKALATDPARRYQTASELHDELVRFTVAGDAVFGSRQLASWLRDEFKSEYEKERKRLRAWLAVGRPPPASPPADPVAPTRPDLPPAPKALPAVIVADLAQTPVDPFPAPRREPSELPTIRLEEKALASAENDRFDLSAERTVAPRKLRASALSRPAGAQASRRWALYAAMPVALGLVGVSWVVRNAAQRDPAPGKLIVMPSPSVDAADLLIDGRPSGQLPPFVHTLAAGRHRIEVRAAGYKPFSANVEVKSGAPPLELTARLETDPPMQVEGLVLASRAEQPAPSAPPPARARSASRAAPATPGPVPAAGRDRIAAAGVAEIPGQTSTAAATPSPPQFGYLVLKTTPSMRLTIDGRDLDRWTPVPPANPVALPAGPHTLLLETADGRRLEERVQIEAGQTARLVRSLP